MPWCTPLPVSWEQMFRSYCKVSVSSWVLRDAFKSVRLCNVDIILRCSLSHILFPIPTAFMIIWMIKVRKDMHKANEMTEVRYLRAICKVTALRWFTVYTVLWILVWISLCFSRCWFPETNITSNSQHTDLSKHNLTCVAISLAPYQIMCPDRDKRFYNLAAFVSVCVHPQRQLCSS